MKNLPQDINTQFQRGLWTVTKTARRFSSISIDQAHEQTNRVIKESGGAVGLSHDHQALTQWLIVTPEVSRILQEFDKFLPKTKSNDEDSQFQHHEESHSFQKIFQGKVKSLYAKILEYGNPFSIEHENLLKLVITN